jgi:hypothetical protein
MPGVANALDTCQVSQNRRRYRKHGYDLDLTYVTDRIIAMSAPAFGGHGAYRNDMHVVASFLAARHYARFFVFNLCDTYFSSDGALGNYSPDLLYGHCLRIPFEDHSPPLLGELLVFCAQATRWCQLSRKNVVAVHCKGGKGRTGVMIAALVLWSGHRRCARDALELFSFRRTANYDAALGVEGDGDDDEERRGMRTRANRWRRLASGRAGKLCNQGVDGPSQIRYVFYMEALLYGRVLEPYRVVVLRLASFSMTVGIARRERPWHCSFRLLASRTPIFDSLHSPYRAASTRPAPPASLNSSRDRTLFEYTGAPGSEFVIPVGLDVWGDVRLEVYRHRRPSPISKRSLCLFCVFNTLFYQVPYLAYVTYVA